jgi:hypothetical protein
VLISPDEPVQALWQVIGDLHQAQLDAHHRQRLAQALAALAAPTVAAVTIWAADPPPNPLTVRPWLGTGEASARALALQAAGARQTASADCPHIIAVPLIAWGQVQGVLTLQTAQRAPALLAAQRALEQCAPFLATFLQSPTVVGRGYLYDHLEHELTRARRLNCPLAVLLIHHAAPAWAAGPDGVSLDVAGEIQQICRRVDIVGRYDEARCLMILPDTACRQARRAAARFGVQLQRASAAVGRWDIGIAGFPVDGGTTEELLASAESALAETRWHEDRWDDAD